LAYSINGTQYVNSSGQFTGSHLFKTLNGYDALGSGNVDTFPSGTNGSWGSSHNVVGSLCSAFNLSYSNMNYGDGVSGSSLYHFKWSLGYEFLPCEYWRNSTSDLHYSYLSGTWRALNFHTSNSSANHNSLFIRIS